MDIVHFWLYSSYRLCLKILEMDQFEHSDLFYYYALFSSVLRCAVSYPSIDVGVINLPVAQQRLQGDRVLLNVALRIFFLCMH